MTLDGNATNATMTNDLAKLAGRDQQLRQFTELLYASSDLDQAGIASTRGLLDQARLALQFVRSRQRGRHSIRLRTIESNTRDSHTVLEILNDDMPFLVDSVVAELQARGISPRLILHPIFKTRRDPAGALEEIVGPGDRNWGDGSQESLIQIHLDRLSEVEGQNLVDALTQVLNDVRAAVMDWQAMIARLDRAITAMEMSPPPIAPGLLAETLAFCRWIREGHFTFLGMRELVLEGDTQSGLLVPDFGTGLGVLRNAALSVLSRHGEALEATPEIRDHLVGPEPLIISKSDLVSHVHRRVLMDYIGLKTYRPDGSLSGELRIVGLFTSSAYTQPPRLIPFIRHRVDNVIAASGFPPASHDGKVLANILDTFPRDELFQISDRQLKRWAAGILDLDLRPRLRVFTRIDRFHRFASVLAFIPRDRFSTANRERISAILASAFNGRVNTFIPFFTEGPLVRVHFIVGLEPGERPTVDPDDLERRIIEATRTWEDQLVQSIRSRAQAGELALTKKYGRAFPAAYVETFTAERAMADIGRMEHLGPDRPVVIDFYREPDAPPHRVRAAIYRFDAPIPLSERVPVLENLGFQVIDERSYRITPTFREESRIVALHDMVLETSDGEPLDLDAHELRMEQVYLAVYDGDADNDGFNRLVTSAGADWREAAALRAYAAYMRQIRRPFGLRYIADTLQGHAGMTRELIELFRTRFDPDLSVMPEERAHRQAVITSRIVGALSKVESLDEDRILRSYLNLIASTLRTNFFQTSAGKPSATIAFKLDSRSIEGAPEPRPFREVWVYSPRLEGIHLRFASIARGGIRWSDRAQDFRTEVLSLCRAQQVKNTIIVPTGAKGGFVPKQLPRSGTRDEIMKEGVATYRQYISALLDITDNIRDGRIVPPERVVRQDPDDPYLVVAADKGTATFSDFANELSTARGFWLGDAFASGGSAGYDHKKMGITARGAWECVKRHFREMDIDIQTTPFRVVGVGDMSGDVFGNGMLLSPMIRLVAAFDHRDIFIDPDPDAARGFVERKRLFELPRSSWKDYDRACLSAGGGVFPRTAKSIALTDEVRRLLGTQARELPPNELIRLILAAETDLLWFGGIGTYIRASTETDEQVGDRANDAVRIAGSDVRARVIGEGANLAVTQRGRIEYAIRGGRIDTDFIDNSAGVNSSDQEVNIKIAVGPAVADGRLDLEKRNRLLAAMTDSVAAACLANNHQQSLALSLAERRVATELGYFGRLIAVLEKRGLIDRKLEALPTEAELAQRRGGVLLSRPELAVLLSWAKIALSADLLASPVPDDPACNALLFDYFPPELGRDFPAEIEGHRLRREIIAMRITNSMLNRAGPAFAVRVADETGRGAGEIAQAYLAARTIFSLPDLWTAIDALDGQIAGVLQLELYGLTQDLLVEQTGDLLRNGGAMSLAEMTDAFKPAVAHLEGRLDSLATPAQIALCDGLRQRFEAAGVGTSLSRRLSQLPLLKAVPAATRLARDTGRDLTRSARAALAAADYLRINELEKRSATLHTSDYYDRLAINGAIGTLVRASHDLARGALLTMDGPEEGLDSYIARHGERLARAKASLDEIADTAEPTISRLVVAAAQVRDLVRE